MQKRRRHISRTTSSHRLIAQVGWQRHDPYRRARRGEARFLDYPPDHVIEACDACGVAEADRQYAIAMFAAPSESDGILQKMRSSKTSTEIRKFLAGQKMFGSSGDGYDYDRYDFHDAGISDIAASGGSGGFDGADGGGDGGGGGD